MFRPLSGAYSALLSDFIYNSEGLTRITKRDFWGMFKEAWGQTFIQSTILSAFKATGLSPFMPDVILKKFNLEDAERPSSSDSSSSVLSASDWRKIERLLRKVVSDIQDQKTRQLSSTIHSISVRNTLLELENKRLRHALTQKKRPTQGKALLLEAPPQYDGGAIFWSPTKVREARQRQEQKDAQTMAKEQEKEQKKALREARKRTQGLRQDVSARGALDEPPDHAPQSNQSTGPQGNHRAPPPAQNTSTIARKGKGKLILPSSIDEEDAEYDLSCIQPVGATPARSRRERPVRPPKRFLQ
ncbi:hypothetical protein BU23DRAFT_463921 [Bimuria novae-zelandiae CBS 107.79]|uniref:Uncharacterized protein n=1 Tax=Bimuria novae-zelandiae CBS 107.79 TaxID=1447943 RepID=A0A6A5VCM5_9PLEO|nr:hypothetical protein BU23DRAFT_463921 [Bimuria novae-zelandiae CBS 107.79]